MKMLNVLGNNIDGTVTTYVESVADKVLREAQIGGRMVYGEELKALLCTAASIVERDMY